MRIAILGASGIAPVAIIDPARRNKDATIDAVASRDTVRAASYVETHGIGRSYGTYEELLADPAIDLVYVSLPPSEHAVWSIRALEAGKHVLCEKPFSMNAKQAHAMNAAAESAGSRLIEAFHDRYHPLQTYLAVLRQSGKLGQYTSIEAKLTAFIPFDERSIRHVPDLGGGALMDLGAYPVHWIRTVTGEEPMIESANAVLNSLGADVHMDAHMSFPSGITGHIVADMTGNHDFEASCVIAAERGRSKSAT